MPGFAGWYCPASGLRYAAAVRASLEAPVCRIAPLDKARLEEVVDAWVTLDASRAARFYATDDPDLTIYDIAPLKYTGWAGR